MQFAAVVLAFAVAVSAQVPGCAKECASLGCDSSAVPCIMAACSGAEQAKALSQSAAICARNLSPLKRQAANATVGATSRNATVGATNATVGATNSTTGGASTGAGSGTAAGAASTVLPSSRSDAMSLGLGASAVFAGLLAYAL